MPSYFSLLVLILSHNFLKLIYIIRIMRSADKWRHSYPWTRRLWGPNWEPNAARDQSSQWSIHADKLIKSDSIFSVTHLQPNNLFATVNSSWKCDCFDLRFLPKFKDLVASGRCESIKLENNLAIVLTWVFIRAGRFKGGASDGGSGWGYYHWRDTIIDYVPTLPT